MDAPWQIELFGEMRARRGDQVVTRFATSRVACLLARLAIFPHRAHPREELIELLWPDNDLDAGRNSLRVALASLRRQIEPPDVLPGSVLAADRSVVRLNPSACRCDVGAFEAALKNAARAGDPERKREALDQALALYQGELLPGFYDDWVIEERERLTALHDEAVQQREQMPVAAPPAAMPPRPEPNSVPALLGFPLQFTRFFGREQECAQAAQRLIDPQTRLLTLTGPGGAGKTRLAIQTAQLAAPAFAGPVCFVALADLNEASLIPDAILSALGLARVASRTPMEQVIDALAAQPPALLVLDNLEHLVERGAPLIFSLLTSLPPLTCLITSRRRLSLPGERQFPVPPLPLPDMADTLEQVALSASAQLFTDRAQAVRPDFQLTRSNAAAVADLCRKLEGLPLAIELVAARSQSLTLAQMADRLEQRFELLTSRRGDKGGRHRSLWTAIAWSHDLLPPPLQQFFLRLSVFRGGCTVEAAQAVCEEPQALEFLTQLRERSLIVLEETKTEMRFRLLESLREFGEEHLPADERHALACRHADYFAALAARMGGFWSGPRQGQALEVLDAESDNLRVALAFCSANDGAGDPGDEAWDGSETGLRLAGSLGQYWTMRGQLREGLGWLEGALAGGGSEAARAKALAEAGGIAAGMGEYDRAEAALTQSLGLSRHREDHAAIAAALRKRGVAALWRGDNVRAAVDLEEALALYRALSNDAGIAGALNSLGVLAEQWRGDKAGARVLYEEALALFRKCGDRQWESYCLHNLGNIAHDLGDNDQAEALLREGLALTDALGDLWQRAYCLRSLGDVAQAQGDLDGATNLLEEGRSLCRRLGDRMSEAGTICSLAIIARRRNSPSEAQSLSQAALALYRDMGQAHGVALCLLELAEIAAEQGQWTRTASLLALKDAACQDASLVDETLARFAALHQATLAALGKASFAAAWASGRLLTLEQAVAYSQK